MRLIYPGSLQQKTQQNAENPRMTCEPAQLRVCAWRAFKVKHDLTTCSAAAEGAEVQYTTQDSSAKAPKSLYEP